jgi:excisionase family DNA binding protein
MPEHTIAIRLDGRLAFQIPEAARIIGISRTSIYRRIQAGDLPSTLIGGRRLILREDLLALLQRSRDDRCA